MMGTAIRTSIVLRRERAFAIDRMQTCLLHVLPYFEWCQYEVTWQYVLRYVDRA